MKILFCNYEYPPLGGGGGVVNAQLAEELAKRHDVSVLTSQAMGLPQQETVNGVEVLRAPVWGRKEAAAASMLSMFSYLPVGAKVGKALLEKRQFDVINTHFVVPTGPLGAYLAGRAGIPNVLTVHGGDLYDPSKASSPHRHLLLRILIRRLLNNADAVVGQSKNTVENVNKYYVEDLDCELIPLGIVRPKPPQQDRHALGFGDDDKILVTVGRLVARKAVSQLIDMVARIDDPTLRLVIIGDGPKKPELEAQASRLGVADQVRFAGFVEEQAKTDLLHAADLYVSTSQHEGFGLVFLEAMAAGLPVVCYDFGGQSDFLEHGASGALVPLNDQEAFRRECEQLLASPQLRDRVRNDNLVRVEPFYIDACARGYEALFARVVATARDRH
jgi:glycosyltransferase involved in cell wall biosynthesis